MKAESVLGVVLLVVAMTAGASMTAYEIGSSNASRPIIRIEDATPAIPQAKAPSLSVQPSKAYKLEVGDFTSDFGTWKFKAVVTPLLHQTDYGELRCAFYGADGHVVTTTWDNWSSDPNAAPIDIDVDVDTKTLPTRGKCWVNNHSQE